MTGAVPEERTRRIGIYGGTFNPIHRGHLKAAREVANALQLDRVIFVPSAHPPHKSELADVTIAPATDRMHWVELAVDGIEDFDVNGLELERGGASYSIDTIRRFKEELAPAHLFFILGYDAFIEMGTWRAPEEIMEEVDIVVMSRPPFELGPLGDWLPDFARNLYVVAEDGKSATHKHGPCKILVLDIDALEISASQIRSRLERGESIDEQVPEAALDAIVSSGQYQKTKPTNARHVAQIGRRARTGDATKGNALDAAKAPRPEPLSDEQCAKLATIVDAALERNAQDPVALDVRNLTSYTDCVVVVTGNSNRQLKAISENIVTALKHAGDPPLGVEGGSDATWMLIDANDVVVHVFEPDSRELFDIEGLWTDAPRVELAQERVAVDAQ